MPAPDRRRRITAFMVAMAVLIATPLVVVASDAFTDVPDSNVHHNDITWLADAAITLGCNPPANDRFCPGDPVLRQQMASFMRRLAENQVVDAATAITAESAETAGSAETASDADALAGDGPDAYRTIINGDFCNFSTCVDHAGGDIRAQVSLTVEVPTAGVLALSGSVGGFGGGNLIQSWIAINQTSNNGCGSWFFAPSQAVDGSYVATGQNGTAPWSLSQATAASVPAGEHTVVLCTFALASTDASPAGLQTVWSQGGSGVSLSAQSFDEADLAALRTIVEAQDQ